MNREHIWGGGRRLVCVPLTRAICRVRKSICIIRNSSGSTTIRNVTPPQIPDRQSTSGKVPPGHTVDLLRIERSFFGRHGVFPVSFPQQNIHKKRFFKIFDMYLVVTNDSQQLHLYSSNRLSTFSDRHVNRVGVPVMLCFPAIKIGRIYQ